LRAEGGAVDIFNLLAAADLLFFILSFIFMVCRKGMAANVFFLTGLTLMFFLFALHSQR
jgi:hypothetical protein